MADTEASIPRGVMTAHRPWSDVVITWPCRCTPVIDCSAGLQKVWWSPQRSVCCCVRIGVGWHAEHSRTPRRRLQIAGLEANETMLLRGPFRPQAQMGSRRRSACTWALQLVAAARPVVTVSLDHTQSLVMAGAMSRPAPSMSRPFTAEVHVTERSSVAPRTTARAVLRQQCDHRAKRRISDAACRPAQRAMWVRRQQTERSTIASAAAP